ncbi:MAG: EamA family transporter RarD [Rhodospirillales bacterium]|nr:MAG: EamA family transporter RarD [Rhodospirillales bacterium]
MRPPPQSGDRPDGPTTITVTAPGELTAPARLPAEPPANVPGLLFAAGAFGIWGLFPLYFKLLAMVPAVEVLAHRVVWSALFAGLLLTVLNRWREVIAVFADRRLLATLALSTAVITLNWGVFIWAVAADRVLEASLGYYINPLVSVALGVVVLRERLHRLQWAAVILAALAVAYEVLALGRVPWVSLTLAVSFGLYGLIRKVARVEPLAGLFVETLIAAPLALGYLLWLAAAGTGAFAGSEPGITGLLALAGVVTALPLLLFVAAARRIRLSTLGLMQYLVPTLHFLLAVLVFGERLTADHLVTFIGIWIALALYSAVALRQGSGAR